MPEMMISTVILAGERVLATEMGSLTLPSMMDRCAEMVECDTWRPARRCWSLEAERTTEQKSGCER